MNPQLTKNFHIDEFRCKDGTDVPENLYKNVLELAQNLQVLRDSLGVPIHIMSAYRTEKHNKKVGGAKNSQHLYAKAGDLKAPPFTPIQVKGRIEALIAGGEMKQGGLSAYPTFTHYDIRGVRARW